LSPVYRISRTYSEIQSKIQSYLSRRVPILLLGNSGSQKEKFILEILRESNLKYTIIQGDLLWKAEEFALEWEKASAQQVIAITNLSNLNREIQILLNKSLVQSANRNRLPALVSTASMEIRDMVRKRDFSESLFFQLGVATFDIPPLFQRKSEILPLCQHFLEFYAKKYNKRLKYFDKDLATFLLKFHFPGDLQELESLMECLVIAGEGRTLRYEKLPENFFKDSRLKSEGTLPIVPGIPLQDYEKEIIRENLQMNKGNREKTARILGISLRTLYRKLEEYGLKETISP